jgi:hypothetical protein
MNINIWGPACWNLFHTLAEKIKEDHFPIIGQHLYSQINLICQNLPCKDCAEHAKLFLSKINPNNIKTKNDLKNMLYVFHDTVNKRKQKSSYKYENLDIYKHKNLITIFNSFSSTYNTNGNMQLIAENFYRIRILSGFKRWLMQNMSHFDL